MVSMGRFQASPTRAILNFMVENKTHLQSMAEGSFVSEPDEAPAEDMS